MFLVNSSKGLIHNDEIYTGAREDNINQVGAAGSVMLRLPQNSIMKFFSTIGFRAMD